MARIRLNSVHHEEICSFLPPRSRFGLYFADQALNKFVPSATETVAFRHECLMLNGCRGFHNRIIACKCTQLNVATLPLKLQQNDGEKGVYTFRSLVFVLYFESNYKTNSSKHNLQNVNLLAMFL